MCCLGSATARQSAIECVWIIWSRTSYFLVIIGALTIMDTIYDKQILVSYCRNTSYHVNLWSEPETAGNIEKHKRISEPL